MVQRLTEQEVRDSPAAWFVVLDKARHDNDRDLESRARRELKRLGISVTFHRRRQKEASHAS